MACRDAIRLVMVVAILILAILILAIRTRTILTRYLIQTIRTIQAEIMAAERVAVMGALVLVVTAVMAEAAAVAAIIRVAMETVSDRVTVTAMGKGKGSARVMIAALAPLVR